MKHSAGGGHHGAALPEVRLAAWANREFHLRAVASMARQGIGQFLDVGRRTVNPQLLAGDVLAQERSATYLWLAR